MKSGFDRTLTGVSVLAGLALAGAFLAGLFSGSRAPVGPDDGLPAGLEADSGASSGTTVPAETPRPDSMAPRAPRGRPSGAAAGAPLVDPAPFEGSARVEILNGAGRAGFARDATTRLRDLGHDVVLFGNAERFDHATSVVLDRGGPPGAARAVAVALGIDVVRVEPDADLALDATVILGADWELPPARPEPADGLEGFLRRLLGSGRDPGGPGSGG